MKISQQTFPILLLCILHPASTFTISRPAGRSMVPSRGPLALGMSTEDSPEADATTTFRKTLKTFNRDVYNGKSGDVRPAIQLLTGNPSVAATIKDAKDLLNGVPQLSKAASTEALEALAAAAPEGAVDVSTAAAEKAAMRGQEAVSSLYTELASRGLLRGFGAVGAGDEPFPKRPLVAADLPKLIGLEQAALTPGRSGNNWLAAGAILCTLQYTFGEAAGLTDPALNIIPATLLLGFLDRALFKGAVFETLLRSAFPQYKTKVVRHEAGHFLTAYLLGCPIESCVLSAWQASTDPRFIGAAGTLFFDPELTRGASQGQVKASTIDRYSIIVMAGIAAEAQYYGKAEGGASDEEAIISFLTSIQRKQGWTLEQVRDQARWGVVQAALLLKEHQDSYEALVACLNELTCITFSPGLGALDGAPQGRPLGDCVKAIEDHLPSVPAPDGTSTLPSLLRRADREAKTATSLLTAAVAVGSPTSTDAALGASSTSSSVSSRGGGGDSSGEQWVGSNAPVGAPVSDSATTSAGASNANAAQLSLGVSAPGTKPLAAAAAAGPAGRAAEVKARLVEVEARLAELDQLENKEKGI